MNPEDGRRAVSGSKDRIVRYTDLETWESLGTMEGHSGTVRSVQITPTGKQAVSSSDDKTIRLWDLEEGRCVATLEGHESYVYSVAISPDGTLIASSILIS